MREMPLSEDQAVSVARYDSPVSSASLGTYWFSIETATTGSEVTAERGRELTQSGVDCVGAGYIAGYIAPEDVGEYAEAEGSAEYVTPRGVGEAAGRRAD